MASENLTKEQLTFLEECNLEFSERYTDSDLEYKKIFDLGIPPPPIMYPWYGKGRFNRDRGRGGRYNDYRSRNQFHHNEDTRNRDYGDRQGYREQAGSSYNNHQYEERHNYEDNRRKRYRPY
ncbi:uncharacterized protein LOC108903576 [Anoplophora glabripennis]|nr:uncharacterized protein LOC108903576 [Anoplophora glabripennis]